MTKWLSYLGGHMRIGSSVGFAGWGRQRRPVSGNGLTAEAAFDPSQPPQLLKRSQVPEKYRAIADNRAVKRRRKAKKKIDANPT
ncbi:hypothetical protein [Devosia sp. CN2-171]|uniref:hypothetical protein n=1 Tax=Devosia sp. CN2-171 TaxID=3400909 RepID=UPI003BF83FBF